MSLGFLVGHHSVVWYNLLVWPTWEGPDWEAGTSSLWCRSLSSWIPLVAAQIAEGALFWQIFRFRAYDTCFLNLGTLFGRV